MRYLVFTALLVALAAGVAWCVKGLMDCKPEQEATSATQQAAVQATTAAQPTKAEAKVPEAPKAMVQRVKFEFEPLPPIRLEVEKPAPVQLEVIQPPPVKVKTTELAPIDVKLKVVQPPPVDLKVKRMKPVPVDVQVNIQPQDAKNTPAKVDPALAPAPAPAKADSPTTEASVLGAVKKALEGKGKFSEFDLRLQYKDGERDKFTFEGRDINGKRLELKDQTSTPRARLLQNTPNKDTPNGPESRSRD